MRKEHSVWYRWSLFSMLPEQQEIAYDHVLADTEEDARHQLEGQLGKKFASEATLKPAPDFKPPQKHPAL